jgi:AraC family transcriptional regulator
MNMLKRMNDAMIYIEEHLDQDIDIRTAAGIASCSEYHLRRMFSFLAGCSLGEYIRNRRMSDAGFELREQGGRIIDIALRYGYDSPDSFTRAFSGFHGITPSEARAGKSSLKTYPPMTFQLIIKGGAAMEYRIIKKGRFRIAGIKQRIELVYEGTNPQIDAMWGRLDEKDFKELKSLCDIDPKGIIMVSANFSESRAEGTELDQYIGVATSKQVPDRWDSLDVEALTWAVFTAVGTFPDALQDVWARIFAEWLPSSNYELTGGPELLWNEGKDTSISDFKSEIWIPVRKHTRS